MQIDDRVSLTQFFKNLFLFQVSPNNERDYKWNKYNYKQ